MEFVPPISVPGIPFAETLLVDVLPIWGLVVYIVFPFFNMSKTVFEVAVGKTFNQNKGTLAELIVNGKGALIFV
jgi:hypothetical protein